MNTTERILSAISMRVATPEKKLETAENLLNTFTGTLHAKLSKKVEDLTQQIKIWEKKKDHLASIAEPKEYQIDQAKLDLNRAKIQLEDKVNASVSKLVDLAAKCVDCTDEAGYVANYLLIEEINSGSYDNVPSLKDQVNIVESRKADIVTLEESKDWQLKEVEKQIETASNEIARYNIILKGKSGQE